MSCGCADQLVSQVGEKHEQRASAISFKILSHHRLQELSLKSPRLCSCICVDEVARFAGAIHRNDALIERLYLSSLRFLVFFGGGHCFKGIRNREKPPEKNIPILSYLLVRVFLLHL